MEIFSIGLCIAIIIILINLGNKFLKIESISKEILEAQKRSITRLNMVEDIVKQQVSKQFKPIEEVKTFEQEAPSKTIAAETISAPIKTPEKASATDPNPPVPTIAYAEMATTKKEYKRPMQNQQETSKFPTQVKETPTSQSTGSSPLLAWFKEDWLMKIGSIMVLLALGWFVTYAFMQNWIGPTGRIATGTGIALALTIIGTKRFNNYPNQGGVFLSIGAAIMVITMIASSNYYRILPPLIALLLSAANLGYIAKKAIEYKSRALVYLSITLASICPFLFGYLGNTEFILSYLLILTLATAYINWNWELQELPLISSVIVFLYSSPYTMLEFNNWSSPSAYSLCVAYLTIGLVLAQSLYSLNKSNETKLTLNSLSSSLATLSLIGWSMKVGSQTSAGYIIALWSLGFAILSRILYTKTNNTKAFFTTWILSTVLALLSINILLNLPEMTIAFLVVCSCNVVIAQRVSPSNTLSSYTSCGLILPCLTTLPSTTSPSWEISALNTDALTILLSSLTLITVGLWFIKLNKLGSIYERKIASYILLIVGSIYGYWLIWLSLASWLDRSGAIAISLGIYTIIGLICYFQGIKRKSFILRKYGLILLGIIITRLFLVDLWNMEIAGRIITFFTVGILLVSTAFLGKREKMKITNNEI